MSQMTFSARAGARALNRPTTPTPRLRVVTGAPLRGGGVVFIVICSTLLATGLIGLLLLNTALAQGSFTLHDLRTTSDQLSDAQSALSQSLAVTTSPANLAKRAADMGMVPAESAAFLRLSDGKVIGVAKPAPAGRMLIVAGTTASAPAPATAPPGNTTPSVTTPTETATAPSATTPSGATPAVTAPASPAVVTPVSTAPAPSATMPAKPAAAATTAAKPPKG